MAISNVHVLQRECLLRTNRAAARTATNALGKAGPDATHVQICDAAVTTASVL